MCVPDQLCIDFEMVSFKGSIYKVIRSSPEKNPIDFEMDSLRIPYVNGPGALQTTFLLILKGISEGHQKPIDHVRSRPSLI